MSRKEELHKMVSLLRSQANAASSRTSRKWLIITTARAEQLQGRRAPDLIDRSNKQTRLTKSAA
jgi:hypothetical protein